MLGLVPQIPFWGHVLPQLRLEVAAPALPPSAIIGVRPGVSCGGRKGVDDDAAGDGGGGRSPPVATAERKGSLLRQLRYDVNHSLSAQIYFFFLQFFEILWPNPGENDSSWNCKMTSVGQDITD